MFTSTCSNRKAFLLLNKEKTCNTNLELTLFQDMQNLFLKLYLKTVLTNEDTSRWRLALIQSLFSEPIKHLTIASKPCFVTNHLLKNKVAYKAYLKFLKFLALRETRTVFHHSFDSTLESLTEYLRALRLDLDLNTKIVLNLICALDSSSLHSVKTSINRGVPISQKGFK